jgi:simple sugar transport system ATP-binding protein
MKISLNDIHKHYGQVHANDGISVEFVEGTIHGILGENGAGKSTLMKILSGYIQSTSGTIHLDNKPAKINGPSGATTMGIGMLYQDPLDFPSLTVLENFLTGISGGASLKKNQYREYLSRAADQFGFHLDPDLPVQGLTVGERQQLELLRLLALGVEVLILDEPTTGISSDQKGLLFDALRALADQGKTVILVSHKLEDVENLCDRATVLRLGKITGELDRPFDTGILLEWMFGSPPSPPPCAEKKSGKEVSGLRGVWAHGGRAGLRDCSVTLFKHEVVGLAGLEGSGQSVFLRIAAGLTTPVEGSVFFKGTDMTGLGYHSFQKQGATFLPAARLEEGLIPGLTITEHFAIQVPGKTLVPWPAARESASKGISEFRIAGKPESFVNSLSGGNQQRLLLALMPSRPRLLLLEQPTRGLDVESANWVWERLMAHATDGACVVFTSSELEEIVHYSDRILVFYNGEIIKDTLTCDTTLSELGKAVAGKMGK